MNRLLSTVTVLLCFLASLSAQAAFDSGQIPETGELTVQRITPDGTEAPPGNQIIIEFNRPVVAIGKMERSAAEIPIEILPARTCQWRWITTRTLACELDERNRLQPATEYRLKIRPGIKTLDGVTIAAPVEHHFTTTLPRAWFTHLLAWRTQTRPIIRMTWNYPVSRSTLLKHAFLTDGNGRRYRIAAEADRLKRILPSWLPVPGEKSLAPIENVMRMADPPIVVDGEEFHRVWLIEPDSDLPSGQTITLRTEGSIRSSVGPITSDPQANIVSFQTFREFAFLGVQCTSNSEEQLLLRPGEQGKAELCNPMRAISLQFSAPVDRKMLRDNLEIDPSLGKKEAGADVWGVEGAPDTGDQFVPGFNAGGTFTETLPFGLKAAQAYRFTLRNPNTHWWNRLLAWINPNWVDQTGLKDRFGNPLPGPVTMGFATDHRLPNLVLDYDSAVLEKNTDSEVPIYVNNLDSLSWHYNRLTLAGGQSGLDFIKPVPRVPDIQFAMPVGVREMLGNQSGALWGALTPSPGVSRPRNSRDEGPDALFAEVTPFQIHMKLGHFNSTVWVTDLATGLPVADADVAIYKDVLSMLHGPGNAPATARTGRDGIALLPGTERIDPDMMISNRYNDDSEQFFVRVSKGRDMGLLPVSRQFAIDNYRVTGTYFWHVPQRKFGHMVTWGTTAQGIYRPGDTIQYKLYVRDQDNQTLVAPPSTGYWLEIVDPTGKVVRVVKDVTLSAFGSASGEFALPKNAAVGWYRFVLKANLTGNPPPAASINCPADQRGSEDSDEGENGAPQCGTGAQFVWTPMQVMVSDFTPVPFQVRNQLNGDLYHPGDRVDVSTEARLHSGGPYTQAEARITATLAPMPFVSKHPAAAGFTFGSWHGAPIEGQDIFQTNGPLDPKGEYQAGFSIDNNAIVYGRLAVESAVQDDRGKYVAHQSSADFVGVDRLVGLRLNRWFYSLKDPIAPDFIVTDEHGAPVKGVSAVLTMTRKEVVLAKVKGAGNTYLPDTNITWVKEAECQSVSEDTGKSCALAVTHAGEYKLTAKVIDTRQRSHVTEVPLYVTGRDFVLWDNPSDSSIDVIADKSEYHVGDTAHYLIKNPYPGAQAMITVERYGVIDSFVRPLNDSAEVFDLPIKPDYIPGFYLSVVIMSPRVDKPLEIGQVDLGKPAFRIGYTRSDVKDSYKEIAVSAAADRETYRPGDKVHLSLNARARNGKAEPIELAVVVLDEAVFDLNAKGRAYYDPYAAFHSLEPLDLRNFSLLIQLIGRQKFEKKGANPGGDGGASLDMRSNFKYVSYWNSSLKTDSAGNAAVDFTVPDNLTGWRVLVLANTAGDRFGLGDTGFKVNRPTEIRPEMPNQVAEGDQFEGRFSVMNRTQQERTLGVRIRAEGDVDQASLAGTLEKQITLKPFERKLISLPLKAARVKEDRSVGQGTIRFSAEAGDASDRDGVTHQIPVHKLRSLDVAANYGTTLGDKIEEQVAVPADIHPDSGALSVSVAPSVIGNLEGAFRYLRDYPYPCWEQLLTRGVMAAQYKALKPYLSDQLSWPGHDDLPDQVLARASEFQAPNGGMAYFIATDQHADPYLSAYTALAFNWLRKSGHAAPEDVERRLRDYLKNLLRHDVAPDFYSTGMVSSVRAVALAALAETHDADLDDLQRYAPFVKQMSLFGKAHFTLAALHIKGGETIALDTARAMLNFANETGGKFIFSEEVDDGYLRLLHSPLRENCAVLSAFVGLEALPQSRTLAPDVPFKLVRAITQTRGGHDHWENTQENMFCANALVEYSRAYESERPDMAVAASWLDKPIGETRLKDFRDPIVTFEHPLTAADAGSQGKVAITRQGTGRLYYATRLSYAAIGAKSEDTNAGIEVHREYSRQKDGKWELLAMPYAVRQGDVIRVDLYVNLPAARNFVVVDDPIPGGFEAVNSDLANNSKVDADKASFQAAGGSLWFKFTDWADYDFSFWSFNHKELRHDSARFFADYLPPGHYHLSYAAQAIGAGNFAVMPTLAAEMYDPDIFGKTATTGLSVATNQAPDQP